MEQSVLVAKILSSTQRLELCCKSDELISQMQRFSITPIVDYAGRKYFVVNYPRRGTSGRKQKKFNSLERAEEFCSEIKREWLNTGKIRLGLDSHLHCDVMRAVKLLSGVPNASLERAANVFMQCRSMMEKRGSGIKYEVPVNRRLELSPRFFLMVVNEAKARNVSMNEAVEGLLSEVALCRADQAIRQQIKSEETEYLQLRKRNDIERQKLREMEREAKIWEEYSKVNMMFEQGRQSVLMRIAEYQRRWRQRKKEREAREKEVTTCG